MKRRAAFVMVNHDGGDEVVASVRSLLAHLAPQDCLILVDNGSSDGSGERAAAESVRIIYLSHPENRTYAEANNIGLKRALDEGYRYAGLINPDVRLRPGMADTLVAELERDEEAELAAVSPLILRDGDRERVWFAGGRIFFPISWTHHAGNGRPFRKLDEPPERCEFLSGCCWLSPAEVWHELGLLDPSYGMYCEDVDWSLRARQQGYRLRVVAGAVLVHQVSSSSGGGRTALKMTYRTLAGRVLFHRWTPPAARPLRALLTPPFVAFYALFLYLAEGRAPATAYLRAWRTKRKEPVPWPPSRVISETP